MFVKIIKSYRDIVAVCDSELIGKTFVSQASDDLGKSSKEGKFQLEVKEAFFKGEQVSEEELKKIILNMSEEDAIFNIVGNKSVGVALETGIISKDGVKEIHGVKFAMVLM
jgi:hypothetical protein